MSSPDTDGLSHRIIGLAMRVHTRLSPGLLLNLSMTSLKDGIRRRVL